MRKLSTLTMVALFAVLLVGTGPVQAETYTGCVTPGGTIVHLAVGESPLKPCKKNDRRIHVDNRDARQNHDVDYNHAKVCEAFFQLGVNPAITDAMGCPSDPTEVALGTVQKVIGPAFDENNSACGILNIEQRDEWGPFHHWVVDGRTGDPLPETGGGFMAKHVQVPFVGASGDPNPCQALCEADPKCIAAWEHTGDGAIPGTTVRNVYWCDIFHYSDTVTTRWHDQCSFVTGDQGIGYCETQTVGAFDQGWFVRCEDTLPQLP